MFSGSRHCLRRRAISSLIDKYASAAGPDEPLLFLYPRWFSTTVQRQQSPTTRTVTSGGERCERVRRSGGPPRQLPLNGNNNARRQLHTKVSDAPREASSSSAPDSESSDLRPLDDDQELLARRRANLEMLLNGSLSAEGTAAEKNPHPPERPWPGVSNNSSPNDKPPPTTPESPPAPLDFSVLRNYAPPEEQKSSSSQYARIFPKGNDASQSTTSKDSPPATAESTSNPSKISPSRADTPSRNPIYAPSKPAQIRPTKKDASQSTISNAPPTPPYDISLPRADTPLAKPTSLHSETLPIRQITGNSEIMHEKIKRYQATRQRVKKNPYLKSIETLERLSKTPKMTKAIVSRGQKAIYLSEEALNILTGSSEENKWTNYGGSGCRIHVLRAEESDGLNRRVILSGSPRAIELAEESIAAALMAGGAGSLLDGQRNPSIVPSINSARSNGEDAPRIRSTWHQPKRQRHALKVNQVRPEQIPRPEKWTVLNFAEYVQRLTDQNIPRSMHRQLYQKGQVHISVARDLLYDLFNDPAHEEFFSTRAINLAIDFFYHHSLVPSVRSIFPKFMPFLTVDSFNIMLRSIGSQKDIHTFNYFLELMERLDVSPDGKTWVALVKSLPHLNTKARAISFMKSSGLLENPSTLRALVTTTIADDFSSHLDSEQDAASFLKLMDNRWGAGWLSTYAVNQLISTAVDRGNAEAWSQIEKFCRGQNLKLATMTLNRVLSLFQRKNRIRDSLENYFLLTEYYGIQADAITLQTLFSTAWRTRRYNLCRVLWRYACMHGSVTWGTQNKILGSLLQNTIARAQDKWLTRAGKIVIGVDPDESSLKSQFEMLETTLLTDKHASTASAYLVGYLPDGPQRDEQRKLAKLMLARDLDTVKRFVPKKSLEEMVREATALDLEWGGRVLGDDADVHWMIENAIPVPVWRREGRSRKSWKNAQRRSM